MKTKILIVLTVIFALSSILTAGNSKNRGRRTRSKSEGRFSIAFAAGAGVPALNFAKTDSLGTDSTRYSGYAKTGFHFNASVGYRFSEYIGALVQLGGNTNSFNADGFKSANFSKEDVTVSGTSLSTRSYLAGPFFIFPLGDRIKIEARLLAGLLTTKFSEVTVIRTSQFFSATENYKLKPAAPAFAYNAGASVKFKVTRIIGITLGVDYLGGTPVFTEYTQTVALKSILGNESSTKISGGHNYNMPLGIINASAGATLNF